MKYLDERDSDTGKSELYNSQDRERRPDGLVGLSFSQCVTSIAMGLVDYEEVKGLVTGTSVDLDNDAAWAEFMVEHRGYWLGLAEEAVAIAERLRSDGKIHQRSDVLGEASRDFSQKGAWIKTADAEEWIGDFSERNGTRVDDLDTDSIGDRLRGLLGDVLAL